MRRSTVGILALLGALAAGSVAEAQVRRRWYLRYEQSKPQIYIQTDKMGNSKVWWYFTYTIQNPTDERVPILVDIQLYVESGKSLQTDTEKVKIETLRSTFDPKLGPIYNRPYREKRFGRYYANVIAPEVETEIIAHDLRLTNRLTDAQIREFLRLREGESDPELETGRRGILRGNRGIVEESILRFKEKGFYLNPRELRIKRFIQPGEELHGIAIFTDVDKKANLIETHVSGLQDIFVIDKDKTDPEELVLSYENRVFVVQYTFRGDAYERARDQLLPPPKKFWITRNVGPIASKEAIDALVEMMVEYLKKEWDWRIKGLTPEEIEKFRHDMGLTASDVHNAAEAFQRAFVVPDFKYDRDKSPWENRYSIWKMHEFWLRNKHRVRFNYKLNRYEIHEEPLAGEERRIRDR